MHLFEAMNTPLLRQVKRGRPAALSTLPTADAYLTDRARLFRCVCREGATVLLENCLSLEVIVCSSSGPAAADLGPVKPADGAGPTT